jgi:hypothetical protein
MVIKVINKLHSCVYSPCFCMKIISDTKGLERDQCMDVHVALKEPEIHNSDTYRTHQFLAADPKFRVRFPVLPDFLRSSGSGTGSTQPLEYNWIEELLGRKNRGSGLESREYSRRYPSRRPRVTLHPQKLALTSATSDGRSVVIVRSRTQATEFFFIIYVRSIRSIGLEKAQIFSALKINIVIFLEFETV